ncbi:MAG: DUF4445 domain-containing protein [Solobacterium sp.]|nr:DUF4445 domain-containing protein [Solobacterium sp.]
MAQVIKVISGTETGEVMAAAGDRLLAVLRQAGWRISAPCGGNGTCGKCRVRIRDEHGERDALACRTVASGVKEITIPAETGGRILTVSADQLTVQPGRSGIGAAVDLGTTTIVVRTYDLSSGKELRTAGVWNAQRPYGADVITRMQYCMDHPDGLRVLQEAVMKQIRAAAGADVPLVIAGNTVMEHIAAGLSPVSIARSPFTPLTLFADGGDVPGVTFMPCVAGYVGGDITAGLLAADILAGDKTRLFLDIGTNGEMALRQGDTVYCCAVASGPAFEGAGITCGMPGIAGAVARVTADDGRLHYDVIGDTEAEGICGSGLIDLLGVLLQEGIVDETGLLLAPEEVPEQWRKYMSEDDNGNGIFHLSDRVVLRPEDVRQLQLAKAAVAAGIEILLQAAGITAEDVSEVLLAGGFGNALNPVSAAAIGMIPPELQARTVCIGDAALSGAAMILLDPRRKEELETIRNRCQYLELSGHPDFNRIFTEKMLFGEEEDLWK